MSHPRPDLTTYIANALPNLDLCCTVTEVRVRKFVFRTREHSNSQENIDHDDRTNPNEEASYTAASADIHDSCKFANEYCKRNSKPRVPTGTRPSTSSYLDSRIRDYLSKSYLNHLPKYNPENEKELVGPEKVPWHKDHPVSDPIKARNSNIESSKKDKKSEEDHNNPIFAPLGDLNKPSNQTWADIVRSKKHKKN